MSNDLKHVVVKVKIAGPDNPDVAHHRFTLPLHRNPETFQSGIGWPVAHAVSSFKTFISFFAALLHWSPARFTCSNDSVTSAIASLCCCSVMAPPSIQEYC